MSTKPKVPDLSAAAARLCELQAAARQRPIDELIHELGNSDISVAYDGDGMYTLLINNCYTEGVADEVALRGLFDELAHINEAVATGSAR